MSELHHFQDAQGHWRMVIRSGEAMSSVGQRFLREAIERFGVEKVVAKLDLSARTLEEFRSGQRPISDTLLLKLIDLFDSPERH